MVHLLCMLTHVAIEYVGAVEAGDRDALAAALNTELIRLIAADGDVVVTINETTGEHSKTQSTGIYDLPSYSVPYKIT